ncbi:MAG: hypothetical protein DRQ61_02650 [Gammaproteobacteria bacterium]|nr:MAG: hypothetical protein DRQ56_01885 [Gammaproteobacteria bacterium]RLA23849.1 MAG: hypothetical protein DRQ61_02650 [Gammaproteobacteria bacterium]
MGSKPRYQNGWFDKIVGNNFECALAHPEGVEGRKPGIIPLSPPNNKKGSFFGPFLLFDRTWVLAIGFRVINLIKTAEVTLKAF